MSYKEIILVNSSIFTVTILMSVLFVYLNFKLEGIYKKINSIFIYITVFFGFIFFWDCINDDFRMVYRSVVGDSGVRLRKNIEEGFDINRKNKDGNTLIMLSSMNDKLIDNTRYLLRKGARIDLKNNKNETAIDIARRCQSKQTEKLLTTERF